MRESQGTGITSRNRSIARNTVSGVSRSQLENRNSVTKLSPAEKSVSNNKNAKSSHKNTLINKLLVVDPDKDFSSIVADYLTLFGFQVAHRNTLVSALDYVKRESCDLIFLSDNFDQVHPISSLRKFKKISDSLIVVIATRGDDQLAVELIKAGASDYLSRRVKDNDILASLASLLERLGNQIEQELRESPNEFQDSNASAIHSTDDTEDKLGDRLVQFYEDMSQKSQQHSELPEIDQPRLRDRTDSIADENFNSTHHQVNFDAPEHVDPRTNRAEIKRDSFNRPDLDSVDFGRAELDSRDIRRLDTLERDLNESSQSNEVFERLSLKSEFKSNEQVFSENQRSHTKRQDTANITDLPGNLISLDKDMNIDVINRSASRILGFSVQQNFQKSILEFIPSALQRSFQIEFDDFCQSSHTLDNVDSTSQKLFETVLMIANGQTIPVNCHLSCTETQYHDLDRPQLTRYLLSFEDISEVKSALAKQQYHAMWNSILHSYSYRFINLKLAEFSSELSDIISDTANFFKLDRVAIFLLDRSATSAKIYLEWLKSECASLKQFSKKIDVQKTAMEFEHLFAGKTQLLSPEGTIKESADLSCFGLSEHYAQVGALSSIILPLERHSMAEDKKIMGWLSLDYQTLNNQWNTEDLQLISPLSKLISEAFARRAQEEHRRVTHQKLSENHGRLSEQAFTDGLTNLANRRYFDKVLESEVRRASRDQSDLAVLFCDVDYFKAYNDTYGHLEGDICLKAIADVLKNEFQRASDFVARFGGEEFAIILSGMSLDDATDAAEKLNRKIIEQNILHHGSPLGQIAISIGLACISAPHPSDAEKILSKADKALYKAKSNGRNRVEVVSYNPR